MGINKKMPPQEIGLYRMAKEAKALKEAKKEMNKTMMIMAMSKEMTAPCHKMMKK
jgi:hypothetical protein